MTRRCKHGYEGSCPCDSICQMRLGGEQFGEWQTHSVYACDADVESWRRQVAPVLRRRNYETRVIQRAKLDA